MAIQVCGCKMAVFLVDHMIISSRVGFLRHLLLASVCTKESHGWCVSGEVPALLAQKSNWVINKNCLTDE